MEQININLQTIPALILAGGLGTRLRPVLGEVPKVLAPVRGYPFIHYILHFLSNQGVSNVVLCTGYAAIMVEDYCKDGKQWGISVHYAREEHPLGTGGAVKNAQSLINSELFLVLNADSFIKANLSSLVHFHLSNKALISLVLVKVTNMSRYGSVLLGCDGSVSGFTEKGQEGSGLINAGIYLFEKCILDSIPADSNVSLEKDVFPRFVGKGLYGKKFLGPFIDIGTPDSYAMVEDILTPDIAL